MGNSFFRKAIVLGALVLVPAAAHADDGAVGKANRAIDDARNNTKRALKDTGNKVP